MTTEPSTAPAVTNADVNHVLLSVRGLTVGFRTRTGTLTTVVHDLSVDLNAGGSLAVVGESGSGKTVSMRGMLGLLPDTAEVSGEAFFTRRPPDNPRDLLTMPADELRQVRGAGIGMVFQNAMTALNPTRTLKVQLTEHLRWHGIARGRKAHDLAVEALDRVGIPEPERRIRMYPFQLSGGMRQRAMIAMAIVARPSLLIADEPTTAVDVTLQRQILDVLKQLRDDDGMAVIVITHDLGVAKYFCDDVVVMRRGDVVESARMAEFIDRPSHEYSRDLLDAALDIDTSPASSGEADASRGGEDLVHARDLVKIFHGRGGDVAAITGVDVTINKGETVGVVGESGSGKSTLARVLMRLVEPTDGSITFDNKNALAARGAELKLLRRRAQMIFQDPYGSLLPHLTVTDNVVEPLRVHGVGTAKQRRAKARELLNLVGIDAARAHHYPRQFSGGQQQRVAIARALALEPELLVCDEPTSALDVSIQAQVLSLLEDLQRRLGLSMLFITHNLAVAQRLCDRILVMANGHIVEAAPTPALFSAPHHLYTRTLLAAVLPVRGEPTPWQPGTVVDTSHGELTEVAPAHWARVTSKVPPEVPPKETSS